MTDEQHGTGGTEPVIYFPSNELAHEQELLAFESVVQGQGPLRLFLTASAQRRYEISFPSATAFMFRDEGDAFLTVQEIKRPGEGVCHMVRVENSRLLNFFHLESGWKNDKLSHWIVLSTDTVVDVISFGPPQVTRMPQPTST